MDQCKYNVVFEPFAERHFMKSFAKKYKSKWMKTRDYIEFMCGRIDNVLESQRADLIASSLDGCYRLVKLDFAIFGIKMSPKRSGNRCILCVDDRLGLVRVLLVYAKTDLPSRNETQEWKRLVKDEYGDVKEIFNL